MHGPVAYTDGACLGNPGPGGWGVRILHADGTVCELGGREPATTNNRMELQAAIAALQVLHTSPQVAIFTDSRYVIDGRTKWLRAWRRRGWLTSANTPVKNRDLWMTLERLSHAGVRWQHVYGHRGDPNNERVDAIARAYAAGTCPPLFCGQRGAPDDPVVIPPAATALPAPPTSGAPARGQGQAYYVSIVHGTAAIDTEWPACAARVRGVSGAQYRKVRSPEELAAFCAVHGVEPPRELA